MRNTDAVVIWTPAWADYADEDMRGKVRVIKRGTRWERTTGDLWMPAIALGSMGMTDVTKDDPVKALLAMYLLFHSITVRDGVNVQDAHQAFLAIDEYRRTISRDIKGAVD